MIPFLIILGWIAIGAAVGYYEARRGHWRWLWLIGAIAGPLAIPIARQTHTYETEPDSIVLGESPDTTDRPGLSVLVGLDGSPESISSSESIVRSFGPMLAQLTLATVIDYESMSDDQGALGGEDKDRRNAETHLAEAADDLERLLDSRPTTVLLAGKPAAALQGYAQEQGFDMIVIGRRGRGLAKRLIGSCAEELARHSPVPVAIMPPVREQVDTSRDQTTSAS